MKLVFLLALTLLIAQSFASTECTVNKLETTGQVPLATFRMEYDKSYALQNGNLDVDGLNLKARVDLHTVQTSPDEAYETPELTVLGYNPYRFKNKYSSLRIDSMTVHLTNKRSQDTYAVKCVVPTHTKFYARTAQGELFYDKELNYKQLRSAQCLGGRLAQAASTLNALHWSTVSENEVLYRIKGQSVSSTPNGDVTWTEEAKKCVTTQCAPDNEMSQRCSVVCSDLNQDRIYTLPRCD